MAEKPNKRRYVGPGGAVFVPNVDEVTIRLKVAAGEWKPVEDKPKRVPRGVAREGDEQ